MTTGLAQESTINDWHNSQEKFQLDAEYAKMLTTPMLVLSSFTAGALSAYGYKPFLQERIGKDGKPFKMPKLQTMPSTNLPLKSEYPLDHTITIIRKMALDEMIQITLISTDPQNPKDMSFISHRPQIQEELDDMEFVLSKANQGKQFQDWYEHVYCAKRPGLFSNESLLEHVAEPQTLKYYQKRMELGWWYQKNGSSVVDQKIAAVIFSVGAQLLPGH